MAQIFLGLISFWGGLLFGLDIGSMTGSVLFLKDEFQISASQIGLLVGASLLGCGFGSCACAPLSATISRKSLIGLSTLLYLVGALTLYFNAGSLYTLYLGRILVGLGIGISAFTLPLYVAELSPKDRRGTLVALYQLAITAGVLIAFMLGYLYAADLAWRPLFLFNGTLSLLFLAALPFFPRGPSGEKYDFRFKNLFLYRKTLLIGMGMAFFQQMTGINAVIFYAPSILQKTGIGDPGHLLLLTLSIGVVNLLSTLVCTFLIDKVGRRPLLLTGLAGMLASFILLYFTSHATLPAVLGLMLFIGCFAFGIGPLFWVICSEIFPAPFRGVGLSIANVMNWLFNFLVSSTFLILVELLGLQGVFLCYGIVCLAAILFARTAIPETKGQSLETIADLLESPPG